MAQETRAVRLAAVGDIHGTRGFQGALQPFFSEISNRADILLLLGDLTGHGLPEEMRLIARELTAAVRIPVVAVLGNHDYEAGKEDENRRILNDAGVKVLDGDSCVIEGLGFAGAKGFGGGFGDRGLQSWGEPAIKGFVRESVEEALKLESGLAELRTSLRFALLHYSPIQATVEGEPLEVYPFLGSSRLEDPLNRYHVTAAFHGHAHRGSPEGRTAGGVPVYNVAKPLLERLHPRRPPFFLLEAPVEAEARHGG